MTELRTEFPFVLPRGFLDAEGRLHRVGAMRPATSRDELEPLEVPEARGPDDPHLPLVVLARVITGLGTFGRVSPRDLEGFDAADLDYLKEVYRIVNQGSTEEVRGLLTHLPRSTTPVSDAARAALLGMPAPKGWPREGGHRQQRDPAPTEPDPTGSAVNEPTASDPAPQRPPLRSVPPPRRSSRRAQVEEIGRSTGRPRGR